MIQSIVFSIILCTTIMTTILTFLVDKTWVADLYGFIFRMLGIRGPKTEPVPEPVEVAPIIDIHAEIRAAEETLNAENVVEAQQGPDTASETTPKLPADEMAPETEKPEDPKA
jgi:hypothetical protein